MEALTRIVADSLARHGFDRPVDPRRLQWSRWFRCDSPHSLLVVPSKPGIFALAEEIMDLGGKTDREGHDFSRAVSSVKASPALAAAGIADGTHTADNARRMLAVLQFSEDDDMAFTLDRMFTCTNPMRDRLATGRCFLRFVVIEDETQRRTICAALNQWMLSTAEKVTGLPPDFQSSLELARVGAGDSPAHVGSSTARVGPTLLSDSVGSIANLSQTEQPTPKPDSTSPALIPDSGANKNLHCPHPLPSGF